MKISPFAPKSIAELPPIKHIRIASMNCKIKSERNEHDDTLLILFDKPSKIAGLFTNSGMAAAAVKHCRELIKSQQAKALLVNSDNANAFTGEKGEEAVKAVTSAISEEFSIPMDQIYICSTGVIGVELPHRKITDNMSKLHESLKESDSKNWLAAAKSIITTDSFPKLATRKAMIDGVEVTINGFAKGSGMIAPDMATMLGFIFTDAALDKIVMRELLTEYNEKTFNSITVDGDTSTNDSLLFFANDAAGNTITKNADDKILDDFKDKLQKLMLDLAKQIIRDGEGISKFITINVDGCKDNESAKDIAMSIANSPLVKTAIAGEDANWGRIIAAIGKASYDIAQNMVELYLGNILVTENGAVCPNYSEEEAMKYMKNSEIEISVKLGNGSGNWRAWTSDLTHEYISINADYRS